MGGWKRWGFAAALSLTIIFAAAYVGLYFLVQSTGFQQWLTAEVARKSGYEIRLGDFRLVPPLRFIASAVVLSKSNHTILQGERITLTLSPFDLFSRSIHRLELHKPTLFLDLNELFQTQSQRAMDVAVRRLSVEDGTVVLTTGEGHSIDFRSVTMNADNLNLAEGGDLTLRTEIPWLQGRAEINFRGQGVEKILKIRIQKAPVRDVARVLAPESQNADALNADIKLFKNQGGELEALASGKLNQLRLGRENYSGQIEFHTQVDLSFKEAIFRGKVLADFPSNIVHVPAQRIAAPVTATVAGRYSIPDGLMTVAAFRIGSALGTADGRGAIAFKPQFVVSNAHVSLRKISAEVFRPLLPSALRNWTYDGVAEADLEVQGPWPSIAVKGVARGEVTRVRSEHLSLAHISVEAFLAWAEGSIRADSVRISGKNLAVNRGLRRLTAREIQIEGSLEKIANQPLRTSSKLQVLGGGFASSDGSQVGEDLRLSGLVDAQMRGDAGVTTKGKVTILEGGILWGKFFGDLRTRRPSVDFDGDYLASEDLLRLRQFNLSLENIGALTMFGRVVGLLQSPTIHVEVKSDDIQLAGFFEFFIRETLNRTYPILDELALGGGLAFSLNTQGNLDNVSVEGRVQVRAGQVRTKSNRWHVGPVTLDLPLRVHYPAIGTGAPSKNILSGTLAIRSARFGSESIPPLTTTVSLWNNKFQLHQPVRIPIYGGAVEISNLSWKDMLNAPQAVSLALETRNLQLKKLTDSLDWYPLSGTLTGSIPQIEWADGSLRTQGQIQLDVFGGHAQISKMEIENPFSSVPSMKLDVRFQNVQLEQASETFKFGRISGILEGDLNNLVIIAGQPSQFIADIHTVDRPGSSQWINVEALNKLTILGSGDDAPAAYGGLAVFFENFRYNKMGFKATLKNDKLTLRGIESKDGKEFLVVGSVLPPTVNIISHTQEISFSELVRRLERVKKSDKPEIK